MQTQATSLVNFSVQTPPTGSGRNSSSSDKAFAACLSDKQQAGSGNKAVSRQAGKADAETAVKKDMPQDDKQQPAEESTIASAAQSGVAEQPQPVAVQPQSDSSADLSLRMAAFTPVNGFVQIANANAAGKSNSGTVVNVQAVNANAGSAMTNMISELAMQQNGQLSQAFSGVQVQAETNVATTVNAAPLSEVVSQQPGALNDLATVKTADAKLGMLLKNFAGQNQQATGETVTTAESTVVQQPAVSALNQPPTAAAQQTTDVDATAKATTAVQPTVATAAAAQQAVQTPVAGVMEQAVSVPQQQIARTPDSENVKPDEQQLKTEMPVDSIKAVGAPKGQAEAKQGQQAGGEKLPTDAGTAETNQEKSVDVNPLNYASVKSSVEVVTHSGAAVDKQNAVQPDAILRQVADQVRLTHRPGTAEMIMHLKPEQLGDVTVKLMMESGRLTAKFHADNPEVRMVLENSLQQLKQELTSVGIKVHDVGVYAGLDNPLGQQGERGQAWAGMMSNGNSSRKTEVLPEAVVQELEQQSKIADSSDVGVDYRV